MALVASGCVVAGPPDYQDPQQTPPVLDLSGAYPTPQKVIIAYTSGSSGPTSFTISVNERSEDANDGLVGLLYLDYPQSPVLQPGIISRKPASFDTVRNLQISWSASGQSPGCHSLTLLVTHASNVDFLKPIPVVSIVPKDDVAYATWWVDIVDPNSPDSTKLDDCVSLNP